METVTSVLALIAGGGAVALVLVFALGDRAPARAISIARAVHERRTEWTFAVAAVATLGSLYFSEVADFFPCRLCWFQRIVMYPIALIALVALLRRDRNARWYVVPFAIIGAGISLYHYLIEWGVLSDSDSCHALGMSCAAIWFRTFGLVTLAFMALSGFVAIIVLNLVPPERTGLSKEDS
jgi:disulfide bond formation protein DsbB